MRTTALVFISLISATSFSQVTITVDTVKKDAAEKFLKGDKTRKCAFIYYYAKNDLAVSTSRCAVNMAYGGGVNKTAFCELVQINLNTGEFDGFFGAMAKFMRQSGVASDLKVKGKCSAETLDKLISEQALQDVDFWKLRDYRAIVFKDSVNFKDLFVSKIKNYLSSKKIKAEELRTEELAAKKKKAAHENEVFTKGNADEITKLIADKYGSLEYTSPEAVAGAQRKLEPFCIKGNSKTCFVLYDLYGLSDFKAKWNRTAQTQCGDLKKSYDYLYRSCELGYSKACEEVISEDDLNGGYRSAYTFIREPGQDGLANDEAKGVSCKMPTASQSVYTMKKQCDDQGCISKKLSDVPLEKMTYDQLVADSFYEKACEKKKGSRACIDWAIDVYEANVEKGGDIFRKTCEETKDKDVKSDCENLARDFMPGE